MKILSGIPTRKRSTSGKIADVLAEVSDEVIVISQGAICNHSKKNVKVIEKDENFGLVPARNFILDYAINNGFDMVLQSDDDLSFYAETPAAMIELLIDEPKIGTICSASRAYFNWSKDLFPNKNYVLAACAPQFWAARTSVLRQVGYWYLPYLEDREYACRMWKCGFPIVQMHIDISLAHNPFMSRNNDQTKQGGQDEGLGDEEKHAGLKKAIDYMNSRHQDLVTMKYLGIKGRSFQTRYNWDAMIQLAIQSGRTLGYEDQRGRVL